MRRKKNLFVDQTLLNYSNSKNRLNSFIAKDINRQKEPFAYMDEIIQRGF